MVKVPLLSIIIPNYNSGKLLEESLQSIFKHEVSFSFEVLIMDNCSIDNPNRIVEKFLYKGLHFFSEPDSGIYNAMNKGIKKAMGEWIYFLGSGDIFNFNEVEKINFKYFRSQNVELIYGNVFMVNKNIIYDGAFSLSKLLKKNICHQSIFFNKVIFQKFGFFNERFKIAADYDLNLKIFFNDNIKKDFKDIVIANYYGDGISDKSRDRIFSKSKNKLIILYFIKKFNFKVLPIVLTYYSWIFIKKFKYELLKFNKV